MWILQISHKHYYFKNNTRKYFAIIASLSFSLYAKQGNTFANYGMNNY